MAFKSQFIFALTLGASACVGTTQNVSAAPGEAASATPHEGMSEAEMAELEKKMMESAQPGPEHETLAKMVGDWNMKTLFTMGPEPMELGATVHSEMILGGRFLLQTISGGEGEWSMDSVSLIVKLLEDGSWHTQVIFKPGTFGNEEPLVAVTRTPIRVSRVLGPSQLVPRPEKTPKLGSESAAFVSALGGLALE